MAFCWLAGGTILFYTILLKCSIRVLEYCTVDDRECIWNRGHQFVLSSISKKLGIWNIGSVSLHNSLVSLVKWPRHVIRSYKKWRRRKRLRDKLWLPKQTLILRLDTSLQNKRLWAGNTTQSTWGDQKIPSRLSCLRFLSCLAFDYTVVDEISLLHCLFCSYLFLFVWFESLRPINNLSVI